MSFGCANLSPTGTSCGLLAASPDDRSVPREPVQLSCRLAGLRSGNGPRRDAAARCSSSRVFKVAHRTRSTSGSQPRTLPLAGSQRRQLGLLHPVPRRGGRNAFGFTQRRDDLRAADAPHDSAVYQPRTLSCRYGMEAPAARTERHARRDVLERLVMSGAAVAAVTSFYGSGAPTKVKLRTRI